MKTKIKFSDIAGMLERDEMKEIVGGSGSKSGGGGRSFCSGTALGGGSATFGGADFNYSGGGIGGGLSSDYGPSTSSNYGGSSYGGGTNSSSWQSSNGVTTTDRSEISRLYEYLTGQSNGQNISNFNPTMSDINSFIAEEIKFAIDNGVITLPNGTIWGGQLNEVIVYHNSDPRSPNYNSAEQTFNAVAFGWDMKTMLSEIAIGGDAAGMEAQYLEYLERAGFVGLAIGGAFVFDDIQTKGLHDYHVADLGTQALIYGAASVVPVAGWALGAAYFLGNYYTERNYGEGLYEHLNAN
jgi:hypothetical protein